MSHPVPLPQWAHREAFFDRIIIDDDATARNFPICRDHCQPCDALGLDHRHPMGRMVSLPLSCSDGMRRCLGYFSLMQVEEKPSELHQHPGASYRYRLSHG